MTFKKSKARGFRKDSILYFVFNLLKEFGKPMKYKQIYDAAIKKGLNNPSRLKRPGSIRHGVREDMTRRKDECPFQVVGYWQIGLREWGYPDFDETDYLRKLKEEKLANKKVLIMAAMIEALEKKGKPMRVIEIFDYVKNRKNVKFMTKTPYKTVNSNLNFDLKKNGDKSRFVRISKGIFGMRKWM
jgi:hypothetical protein